MQFVIEFSNVLDDGWIVDKQFYERLFAVGLELDGVKDVFAT